MEKKASSLTGLGVFLFGGSEMPSEPKTAIFTKAANLFFALLQTGVLSSMDRWGSL